MLNPTREEVLLGKDRLRSELICCHLCGAERIQKTLCNVGICIKLPEALLSEERGPGHISIYPGSHLRYCIIVWTSVSV